MLYDLLNNITLNWWFCFISLLYVTLYDIVLPNKYLSKLLGLCVSDKWKWWNYWACVWVTNHKWNTLYKKASYTWCSYIEFRLVKFFSQLHEFITLMIAIQLIRCTTLRRLSLRRRDTSSKKIRRHDVSSKRHLVDRFYIKTTLRRHCLYQLLLIITDNYTASSVSTTHYYL